MDIMETDTNREIWEGIDVLVAAIKKTTEYQEYEFQKEKIKRIPELKARIDDFRKKNYELQNSPQSDNLMEAVERFQKEYESFMENPLVADFLQAELAFCRLMQDVNVHITAAIDFE